MGVLAIPVGSFTQNLNDFGFPAFRTLLTTSDFTRVEATARDAIYSDSAGNVLSIALWKFSGTPERLVGTLEIPDGDGRVEVASYAIGLPEAPSFPRELPLEVIFPSALALDLSGSRGDDTMTGSRYGDEFRGRFGNDRILGFAGDDLVYGGTGKDRIDCGSGNDTAWGGRGNDILIGGRGNDYLMGEGGRDVLVASAGTDVLFGDAQGDRFVFATDGGSARVADFSGDEGDRLVLFLDGVDGRWGNIAGLYRGADRFLLSSVVGDNALSEVDEADLAALGITAADTADGLRLGLGSSVATISGLTLSTFQSAWLECCEFEVA